MFLAPGYLNLSFRYKILENQSQIFSFSNSCVVNFSICSKDLMKCLHVGLYSVSKMKFTKITQKPSME